MKTVKIGNKLVGEGLPTFIIAEIGINHNGDLDIAKKLIDIAVEAGADAIKFQKRTVEIIYTPEELATPRENPFGPTNGDLKQSLEFGQKEYEEIDIYCKEKNIMWFASPWDEASVDFLEQFNPPCHKIASCSLTDDNLLLYIRSKNRPIILSTGMSTLPMIEHAVDIIKTEDLVLMHCTSAYPTKFDIVKGKNNYHIINLNGIHTLQEKFPKTPIGYSSHDAGIQPSYAATAMGAKIIEKHICINKLMWGSDQASSTDADDFKKLCRIIRELAFIKGDGIIQIFEEEKSAMKKLRRKWGIWDSDAHITD